MIYISVFHAAGAGGGGGGNFPAGITSGAPADTIVNASVDGLDTRNFLEVFNGTTWDRVRTVSAGNATAGTGILGAGILFADTVNGLYRQWPATSSLGDTISGDGAPATGAPYVFNGGTLDRLRNNSVSNLSAAQQNKALMIAHPVDWSIFHTPGPNIKATITRAAGAAGVRHICTSISAALVTATAAAASGVVQVSLIDGVSGGAAIWSKSLAISAASQNIDVELPGLNIIGSAATAMTLEFSAAGGGQTVESVALTGYDTI